jgi:alpha-mannosidase
VAALALERWPAGTKTEPATAPALEAIDPVQLDPPDSQGLQRLSNGLLQAWVGPEGLVQLSGSDGAPLLAEPPRWRRWSDRGEFWDAWDIAPDHRDHPLPWTWEPGPQIRALGPICTELHWQGRCGRSPARLMLRLLAGTPWLELVLSLDWQQRHELLQLELPLRAPLPRWAADTSGGVIERPGDACTPREQARWEVPAISWACASDLAVLLDGPQGLSADRQRLTVSLLRAPCWPDPSADNGWQRIRLALAPAPGGWRAARIPALARRFREPLWCRPARRPDRLDGDPQTQGTDNPNATAWSGFPPLGPDLRLVGLRPCHSRSTPPPWGADPAAVARSGRDTDAVALLSVINEGPCRRHLELPATWRVVARLDGLDRPMEVAEADLLRLEPWQLGFWAIRAQSS